MTALMNFFRVVNQKSIIRPNSNQIFFVNQKNDVVLDNFFKRNLSAVTELFAQKAHEFVYIPELFTPAYIADLIHYNFPHISDEDVQHYAKTFSAGAFYGSFEKGRSGEKPYYWNGNKRKWEYADDYVGLMFASENKPVPDKNPLEPTDPIGKTCTDDPYDCFLEILEGPAAPALRTEATSNKYWFAELKAGNDDEIWSQLHTFLKHCNYPCEPAAPREYVCYESRIIDDQEREVQRRIILQSAIDTSKLGCDEICTEDMEFPEEAFQLTEEIKERVAKLRTMGVAELAIRTLFDFRPKLSRLLITSDYRILLTDFQNREIKMGPLPKAFFLLFLRHPEGIIFKEIADYRQEMLTLYCKTSGAEPSAELRKRIEKICTPYHNSINENCSRIRQYFLKEISDQIANYYYVTGSRATPKGIQLDRRLVTYEDRELR